MAIFYAYDPDGWLIGWHTDASKPHSTPVPPVGMPLHEARWDGKQWVRDPSLVVRHHWSSYVNELWRKTSVFIEQQCDTQSRITIAAVLADPMSTAAQKMKAREVQAWVNTIWNVYRHAKERAQSGDMTPPEAIVQSYPPCPYRIWEITQP